MYKNESFWFNKEDSFNLYIKLFQRWCDYLRLKLKNFFILFISDNLSLSY